MTFSFKSLSLCAATILLSTALAPFAHADHEDRVRRLTERNIETFITTIQDISTGKNEEMTPDDIQEFLDHHIADKAHYQSSMTFEIPGMPAEKSDVTMSKEQYINALLEGLPTMQSYDTDIEINTLDITSSGRVADLTTTTTENGQLPWGENEDGEPRLVPVKGVSECEQKIVISLSNQMQMAKAICTTVIRLDPFAGEEFGEPF